MTLTELLNFADWEMALRIVTATVLGGILGLERGWTGHMAGLRTNVLIAVAACLFTILSIDGFPLQGAAQDSARIAAQIVSGVGFLGAGVLFQARGKIRGLTTASTIWLVSAIGMAAGTGNYFLATFTTILGLIVLKALLPVSKQLKSTKIRRNRNPRKTSNDRS